MRRNGGGRDGSGVVEGGKENGRRTEGKRNGQAAARKDTES